MDSNPQEPSTHYTAFLVRLWQAGPQAPWRASAQSARTGEKLFFASLGDLCAFLHHHTDMSTSFQTDTNLLI